MIALGWHFLVGLFVAFVASLPLGPVNLAVIQAALNKGRRAAYTIAFGAVFTEVLYCAMAVLGTHLIFSNQAAEAQALLYLKIASVPLLFALAYYDLTRIIPRPRLQIEGQVIKRNKVLQSGFLLGFSLNLFNPVLLPYWFGISSYLSARGWLENTQGPLYLYVLGVAAGTFGVMALITQIALNRNRSLSYRTRVYISRGIGMLFFVFAIYQCFDLMIHYLNTLLDAVFGKLTTT
jgi:threonine/homoserine/homoserine lactone efflux protein